MRTLRVHQVAIASEADVVRARQEVRAWAVRLRFSLVDQTKIVTAASELARNTLVHGGGGSMELLELDDAPRVALRLVFADRGPGIANLELALRDGYTTGGGLGLGLGGAKRLVNDFDVQTAPGSGTRVTITRWR